MNKFPIVSAKEFYNLLLRYGCVLVTVKGSHFKVENPKNGKRSTIPIHGNNDINRGFMMDILAELGIEADDFAVMF